MAFNNATWEAIEQAAGTLCDMLSEVLEGLQEARGEEVNDPMPLDPYDDPSFKAMKREEQECRRMYGDRFTNLYLEKGREGESPEEFYERCEEKYEHFSEYCSLKEDYDEMDPIGPDEYEEIRQTEDYGMTDEELDSGDNDDWD